MKATTGKVLFTMAGVDYVCSGSVAQDSSGSTSLILTAGHCVYDESGSGFATNWMFVPDYEAGGSIVTNPDGSHSFTCDTTPYGCWTASALVTTTAWASGGGSLAAFNNDYAFAVVGAGGKSGQSLQLDSAVGANPVAFNVAHPTQVSSFGYPQASPYDGQKLIYCSGHGHRGHVGRNDRLRPELQHDGRLVGRPVVRELRLGRRSGLAQLGEQLQVHVGAVHEVHVRPVPRFVRAEDVHRSEDGQRQHDRRSLASRRRRAEPIGWGQCPVVEKCM